MEEYTHPTLDKISALRAKFTNPAYPSDVGQIEQWEKDVRDLVARETLAEDEKLKEILREYAEDIERFEGDLKTKGSDVLPDSQRDRMIDKIGLYRSFIDRFDIKRIRAELETVDKAVSAELQG